MSERLRRLGASLRNAADTVVLLDTADSTHAMALRLIAEMAEEVVPLRPCLLVALEQTAGRGRGQRTWISPAGGLYCNWLRSDVARDVVPLLPILAGAAGVAALEAVGVPRVVLKWPNDLLVDGAKIAGLLSHARSTQPAWVTVALGVNVLFAPAVEDGRPSTCVTAHIAPQDEIAWYATILTTFVAHLTDGLRHPQPAMEVWQRRMGHVPGEEMSVRLASGSVLAGHYRGLTPDGFLRLATDKGERVITAGDILDDTVN